MFKRFVTNTLWSTLALLMMSAIFICIGFPLVEFNFIPRFLIQVLFIGILLLGFSIGGRLYYRKSLSIVSIVILPVLLCAVLYFIGFAVPYIGYIVQYPSPVWIEAYDLSLDFMNELDLFRYYAVLIAHYFAAALSLLLGARKKHKS